MSAHSADDKARSASWFRPLSRDEFRLAMEGIHRRFTALERTLQTEGAQLVANQADIDALTQQVNTLQANLTADDSQIQSGLAAVQAWIAAQPASLDVSGLQSALGTLSSGVDAITADAANVAAAVPPATS